MKNLSNEELIILYRAETNAFVKEDIQEIFFKKNVKLPHFIASKFKNTKMLHDDLTSIASIGMVKAFDKFNLEAGYKFVTYATTLMNNEILMQLRKEKRQLETISIDATLTESADRTEFTFLHLLADETCIETDVEQTELMREIREVAPYILSEKEQFVLFDALSEAPLNQRQLSEKLNISQSYVSRLSQTCIRKLSKYFNQPKVTMEQEKEMGVLTNVVIAKEGNFVEWKHSSSEQVLQGQVLFVRENSVVVDLTVNPNWQAKGLEERTVVSHSKYAIIEKIATETPVNIVENEKTEVLPGSVENYHVLRAAGHKDSSIRALWDRVDTEVNWHNARFYKFKHEHSLVVNKNQSVKDKNVSFKEEVPLQQSPVEENIFEQQELHTEVDMLQEYWPEHPLFTAETKNTSDTIQDEVLQLRNELAQMRNELWSERTTRLFAMQIQLDALICESNGLQIADFETEHILATIVELAEVAQEEQSFKYWKKHKTVDREKLIEEMADVLHFIISRGVQLGFKRVAYSDDVERGKTVAEHMLIIVEQLLKSRKSDTPVDFYIELFNTFRVFVDILEFNWQEVSEAYEKKHSENIARQNRNY